MAMKGRTEYILLSPLTVIWGNIHSVLSLSTEVADRPTQALQGFGCGPPDSWRCKLFYQGCGPPDSWRCRLSTSEVAASGDSQSEAPPDSSDSQRGPARLADSCYLTENRERPKHVSVDYH